MKTKCLAVGIILLFIGTAIIPSTGQNIEKSSLPTFTGKTIYVNCNNTQGPWDGTLEHPYRTIQDGVNASNNMDTVFVFSGVYFENVRVNKSINLTGENRETTIVDANFSGSPISLQVNGISIHGFMAQHSGNVAYADGGIQLRSWGYETNNNMIYDDIVKENLEGIFVYHSVSNRFYNNIMEWNRESGFFCQKEMYNSTINNNIFMNNGHYGIFFAFETANNEIKNNIIKDNNISIYFIEVHSPNGIKDNQISHNGQGIEFQAVSWNLISSNNFTGNDIGVYMWHSRFNVITKNNFIDNNVHATFYAYLIADPEPNFWRGNYWSNVSKPIMMVKGIKVFGIPNPFDPWGPGININVPWYQFDFFPTHKPYNIPGMR
ncbi:MAG TPA: NosD domain-containing protein [Candidatus Thermoplasmatota archaeon]|nr:NosD domain-containing protein [Candidatus Thermoplasmatota archaeon]